MSDELLDDHKDDLLPGDQQDQQQENANYGPKLDKAIDSASQGLQRRQQVQQDPMAALQSLITNSLNDAPRTMESLNKMSDEAFAGQQNALTDLMSSLKSGTNYNTAIPLLALASGILRPTRTGSFGEAMGNAAGAMTPALLANRQNDTQRLFAQAHVAGLMSRIPLAQMQMKLAALGMPGQLVNSAAQGQQALANLGTMNALSGAFGAPGGAAVAPMGGHDDTETGGGDTAIPGAGGQVGAANTGAPPPQALAAMAEPGDFSAVGSGNAPQGAAPPATGQPAPPGPETGAAPAVAPPTLPPTAPAAPPTAVSPAPSGGAGYAVLPQNQARLDAIQRTMGVLAQHPSPYGMQLLQMLDAQKRNILSQDPVYQGQLQGIKSEAEQSAVQRHAGPIEEEKQRAETKYAGPKAFAKSQAELPAELEKIGVQGEQERKNIAARAAVEPQEFTLPGPNGTILKYTGTKAQLPSMVGKTVGVPEIPETQKGLYKSDDEWFDKTLLAGQEAAKNGQANVQAVRQGLAQMSQSDLTKPGALAEYRINALKGYNDIIQTMGGDPLSQNELAGADAMKKASTRLAADMTRVLGSREAAQIFMKMEGANPNWAMSPQSNKLVMSLIDQSFTRAIDRYRAGEAAKKQGGLAQEAVDAFDKAHPEAEYVTKAFTDSGMSPDWIGKKTPSAASLTLLRGAPPDQQAIMKQKFDAAFGKGRADYYLSQPPQ